MIEHRPCGECRKLVSAQIGCRHWRPNLGAPGTWRRPYAAELDPEALAARRAANRAYAKKCREKRMRQDVAALKDGTGRDYR